MQTAYDRENLGITGSCGFSAWGVSSNPVCGPDDNNGLWTSVVVGAFTFKAAVTRDPADIALAWHYFGGMHLLHEVTGIQGYPARSPTMPNETWPSGDPAWHASPSLPGWHFKGTTSSDETDGHAFAYPLVAKVCHLPLPSVQQQLCVMRSCDFVRCALPTSQILAPLNGNTTGRDAANKLLLDMARYIVSNNFTLRDVDGQPTQWGHWEPPKINYDRSWSDTKALNSLEILSYINAALEIATDPADVALLTQGYATLLAAGYDVNIRNTRINAPCDINYRFAAPHCFLSLSLTASTLVIHGLFAVTTSSSSSRILLTRSRSVARAMPRYTLLAWLPCSSHGLAESLLPARPSMLACILR
jgi:hypothetical protein